MWLHFSVSRTSRTRPLHALVFCTAADPRTSKHSTTYTSRASKQLSSRLDAAAYLTQPQEHTVLDTHTRTHGAVCTQHPPDNILAPVRQLSPRAEQSIPNQLASDDTDHAHLPRSSTADSTSSSARTCSASFDRLGSLDVAPKGKRDVVD